jgi:S1-C subfamily serine protease
VKAATCQAIPSENGVAEYLVRISTPDDKELLMSLRNLRSVTLVLMISPCFHQVGLADESDPRYGVVKITSTQRSPNYIYPWVQNRASLSVGTGVVIDGHRILTNAHLVENATQVNVQSSVSSAFVPATVEHLALDVDLAVLKVPQADFWTGLSPYPINPMVLAPRDTVTLCGFSQGTGLSIAEGTVTRTEFDPLGNGLIVEVDASGKPGISGGPALVNGEVAGLAFGMSADLNSIFLIPSQSIDHFLADVEDGNYRGQGSFREVAQTLINPALRAEYLVPQSTSGLLITRPHRDDPAYPIKKGDVLTKVDGFQVNNDGKTRLEDGARLSFESLFKRNLQRDTIPVRLLREGKELTVEYPLRTPDKSLIPLLDGRLPSYFIWGPLAFTPATEEFLTSVEVSNPIMPRLWAYQESPLVTRRTDFQAFEGEQLVVLISMFPHPMTTGYSDPSGHVVDRVNGTKVRNLRHLVRLLDETQTGRATFEFYERRAQILVLDRKQAVSAQPQIQIENGIRSLHSPDLASLITVTED